MNDGANIISLAAWREAKNPPPEPELSRQEIEKLRVPWYVHQATWILREVSKPDVHRLDDREKRFIVAMAIRQTEPTEKQAARLEAITERVEIASIDDFKARYA